MTLKYTHYMSGYIQNAQSADIFCNYSQIKDVKITFQKLIFDQSVQKLSVEMVWVTCKKLCDT